MSNFNELNSVEYYIINQLSGVNLNSKVAQEPKSGYGSQWAFKPPSELDRSINEVLIESELKAAVL